MTGSGPAEFRGTAGCELDPEGRLGQDLTGLGKVLFVPPRAAFGKSQDL